MTGRAGGTRGLAQHLAFPTPRWWRAARLATSNTPGAHRPGTPHSARWEWRVSTLSPPTRSA